MNIVEPQNNGHIGTRHFVLYREVIHSSEVKNVLYSIIGKWNFGTLKRASCQLRGGGREGRRKHPCIPIYKMSQVLATLL